MEQGAVKKYKHILYFSTDIETYTNITEQYTKKGIFYPALVLEEPKDTQVKKELDAWRMENWGCIATSIPVIFSDLIWEFELDVADIIPLLSSLSRLFPKIEIIHKYASDVIGYRTGNNVYTQGRLMNPLPIQSPERFACSIWNVDANDYAKLVNINGKGSTQRCVYASEVAPLELDDDFDEVDKILAQEGC